MPASPYPGGGLLASDPDAATGGSSQPAGKFPLKLPKIPVVACPGVEGRRHD